MIRRLLLAGVLAVCSLSVQFGFVGDIDAQWASNPSRDLFGENMGDFIMIQWSGHQGAALYNMYGSTSPDGPWTLLLSTPDMRGGAKVDRTPDARLMDLCYKVEATNASGAVIRVYQPICVPKYRGKE